MTLISELNAKNKITAIGTLAVPVLRYSFGIINWRFEEIRQIDRKARKVLTMHKMHHLNTVCKGKSEEEACYKLKRHIKQRLSILQNI